MEWINFVCLFVYLLLLCVFFFAMFSNQESNNSSVYLAHSGIIDFSIVRPCGNLVQINHMRGSKN